jgi:hypothetical protein
MRRAFFTHLFFMLLGYALAVLAATTVTLVIMGAATPSANPGNWRDFPSVFPAGIFFMTIYTLPGWLTAVIAAELRKEQRWHWFAAAGVLTALLAIFIAGAWREMLAHPFYFGGVPIGWFIGGLIYWVMAGRRSGNWRSQRASSAQSNPLMRGR